MTLKTKFKRLLSPKAFPPPLVLLFLICRAPLPGHSLLAPPSPLTSPPSAWLLGQWFAERQVTRLPKTASLLIIELKANRLNITLTLESQAENRLLHM